jgi:hypothetical protein
VSLPDGGFVSFQNQSAGADVAATADQERIPVTLESQALADRNQTVHRVLRDDNGKFVFGYDLWIVSDRATKQFRIAIRPLRREMEDKLRGDAPATEAGSTFPKSTEPQVLNDGAQFSLDLLINKTAGVKIVDIVTVTFDRSQLEDRNRGVRARDFTLDAVALEMKDYSLMVNDNLVAMGKSKSGCAGALLWLYIPNHGRFILSLIPREGYAFQKAGTVAGNKIEFTLDGNHYQWFSSSPVLREQGSWNLWVLHDVQYSPLFAVREPPPDEKGPLDKLDATISNLMEKTTTKPRSTGALQVPAESKAVKPVVKTRDDVMFGGADRIENLLPRN